MGGASSLSVCLAVRPIYHFKPERLEARIGLRQLAFALTRHAQQRIRAALHGVQAGIVQHKTTQAKYCLPSAVSHEASRICIYKAFGIKRNLDVQIDLS